MLIVVGAMLIGQLLLTIGVKYGRYSIALTARLILGMGLECQNVVVYAFIALWFTGKEHGLACAGIAMMMRLGMVSTDFITPTILNSSDKLVSPFIFAMGISVLALISTLIVIYIDKKNQRLVRTQLKRVDTLEVKYLKKHEHDLELFMKESGFYKESKEDDEKVHIQAVRLVRSYKLSFWLYSFLTLLAYSTMNPFFANISVLLRDNYNFSLVQSGKIMALPSLIVCIFFPLIGYLSDKFNRRGTTLVIACTILSLTQLYIVLLPNSDKNYHILVPLIFNQIGYATFITNVWPGLSNLIRFSHPEEFANKDEDE